MHKQPGFGSLIIVGGHEDKTDERLILRALSERVGKGRLIITTVASHEAQSSWEEYKTLFRNLGIRHVSWLDIPSRQAALEEETSSLLEKADAVFFTGGDQLRITSQIGDTPVASRLKMVYNQGGIVAGTSAGASVMSETILVSGESDVSATVKNAVQMAPGLGFLRDAIIDQHFAERGRIGRLLAAVAQNPRLLGIGIDENTAIIVHRRRFQVIGRGAVYVADGSNITYTNLVEENAPDRALSIYNVTLSVLSQNDTFDLTTRTPKFGSADELDEKLLPKEE